MKKIITFIFFQLCVLQLMAQNETTGKSLWRDSSTRGFEFTVKGIIGPAGGWMRVHEKEWIPATPSYDNHYNFAGGGGVMLSYRINKCMAIGLGMNIVGGTQDCTFSNLYGNLKFNVYDTGKFLPYISVDVGYDVWTTLTGSFGETEYGKYNGSIVLGPAVGLDFPLRKGSTFVELRADFSICDSYADIVCPSIGFGYTF